MNHPLRILLIEDNDDDSQLILSELKRNGFKVEYKRIETANDFETAIRHEKWDIILCDYSLPKFGAPQALSLLQSTGIDIPFIIISGTISEESAVDSLKAGANDFIVKGNLARLAPAVQRELRDSKVRQEHQQRTREMEAIASISMTLRKVRSLNEMLSHLLDHALDLFDTKMGSIWLYDKATNRINLAIQRGWDDFNLTTSVQPGEGIPGLVFRDSIGVISKEFHSDPRVLKANRKYIPKGIGGACLPLYSEDEIVGVIFVNVTLPREITTGEIHILNALVEIGGHAIHRMRLLEQTLKQLERLKSLRTIDLAISGSLNLNISLKIVLDQIITQLKVDAAAILLLKQASHHIEYFAGKGFNTEQIKATSLNLWEGLAGRAVLSKKVVHIHNMNNSSETIVRSKMVKEENFVSYFGMPLIAKGEVQGVLEIYHRTPLNVDTEWLEFLDALSSQTAIAVDNGLLFENLQRSNIDLALAYNATIEGWSRALDLRDEETEGHSLRVTDLTIKLARFMGMRDDQLIDVKRGALLHDIGKMGVPDTILLKPGALTEDEWQIMRRHPQYAFDLLSPIAYLQHALDIPYCHHEKWNGTGYPRGLKGEEIPLPARIFAVIDVWDALTSNRPYRPAWSTTKTLDHIRENSGSHFDPQVVKIFLEKYSELMKED